MESEHESIEDEQHETAEDEPSATAQEPLPSETAPEEEERERPPLGRDDKLALPLGMLSIGVVLALSATQVSNADLGFHLATGRHILEEGVIPSTNVLSFTEPQHPWPLHEWLASVLFTLMHNAGGALGVFALKLAVIGLTWTFVFNTTRKWGATAAAASLATVFCAWAAATRFVVRPQIFSNLALAAGLWLLSRWLQTNRDDKQDRSIVVLGVVVAFAYQVHSGAISLVIALLTVAVGLGLEQKVTWLNREPSVVRAGGSDALRPCMAAVGGLAAAALALAIYHPHGARVMLVPFELGLDETLRDHVIEYRYIWTFPLALTFPFWLALTMMLASVAGTYRKAPLAVLFPALAFGALTLRHQRVVDAFAVAAAPVIAMALSALIKRLREIEPLALLTLIAIALGAPLQHWRYYPPGPGFNPVVWPQAMFDWVEKHDLKGPAFVSDGWGGPFLARFYPKERSFFDPRFEAYSSQHYLGVYRRIRYGQQGWDKLLDDFGVQLIILKYTSPGEAKRQNGEANVRQRLLVHDDWVLIAFDERGEIFARFGGVNDAQAKRFGMRCYDPDRGVFFAPPASCAEALMGLIDEGFIGTQVLLTTAIAQAHAGKMDTAQQLVNEARKRAPEDNRVNLVNQQLRLIDQQRNAAQKGAGEKGNGASAPPKPAPAPQGSATP